MRTIYPALIVTLILVFGASGLNVSSGRTESAAGGEPARLPAAFSVKDYGAVGDGETKDTRAIQQAIDAAHQAGGGTVYFPPGKYLSGTLYMKNFVTLHLDTGSVLLGSTELADFPEIIPRFRSYTDN